MPPLDSLLVVMLALCLALVFYTYFGYPLLLAAASRLRARPVHRSHLSQPSISIVLAVHNEANQIGRRIEELSGLIGASNLQGEIIVVSDGSTDATSTIARNANRGVVRVIELAENGGKASALNAGCSAARNEVIVFADARQTWASDSLRLLLENFADPEVGAATGDLVIETEKGVLGGIGLYWKFEKCLRRAESRLSSMVGVTGAIAAVRRELYQPIPKGTLLDDVYWPLRVAMQGYRVVHDSRVKAHDRLPPQVKDEFRRKVRTLTGNFQLMARLPAALSPLRNPIWWQFVSHKAARLAVPWALLGMLVLCAALPGMLFATAITSQLAFYALGLYGMTRRGSRLRLAAAAGSFIVLNTAAWLAFWKWSLGGASQTWGKVCYQMAPSAEQQAIPTLVAAEIERPLIA